MLLDFKKQAWITLIVLGGFLLVLWAAFLWLKGEINFRTSEIAEQRKLIQQGSVITETIAALTTEKQAAQPYIDTFDSVIATRDDLVVNFSRWLENEAELFGLGLTFGFQGSESKPTESDLGQVGFSIKLIGAFEDAISFLNHLESGRKVFLMSLDSFDIVSGSQAYTVSASGRVFFR